MHDKLLWLNNGIQYMFNNNIVEYDMVTASLSISERYGLLDKKLIDELKLLPKEKRTRRIGLIQRDDKDFSKQFLEKELEVRKQFIETNNLDEHNIVSLHSDAVFFSSMKPIVPVIDGIEFKHKHSWTSYIRYNGIEMFYNDGSIVYKNVNIDMLNMHTLGINKYLCVVFNKIENYDIGILKYLSKFQKQYLQDKLPEYYYIPFGKNGKYKLDNLELFGYITNIALNEIKGW